MALGDVYPIWLSDSPIFDILTLENPVAGRSEEVK